MNKIKNVTESNETSKESTLVEISETVIDGNHVTLYKDKNSKKTYLVESVFNIIENPDEN